MKKTILFLSLFVVVSLACDLLVTVAPTANPAPLPTNTTLPAATSLLATTAPTDVPPASTPVPAATATVPVPSSQGVQVFYGPVSLVLPPGLASGISGSQFPRVEGSDVAPWEVTPGHTQVTLEGYLLQGKMHQPQIFVYPAQAYVEMLPGTFESIHRLQNLLYDPNTSLSSEFLPAVPFFNAAQVFASNIQVIPFQNGQGVRFLTEYAQYPASANNHDLFYEFQGVTADGANYIIAILPVTAPMLAETSDGGAVLPPGGVPYPDITAPNPDMQAYYTNVTVLLNGTSPDTFAPTITKLDALVQSMRVAP